MNLSRRRGYQPSDEPGRDALAADPLPATAEPETDFDDLLRTHAARVYGVVHRLVGAELADDACQEVWLAIHKALPSFRGDAKLTTWMYGVAARVCGKLRRRRRLVVVTPEPDTEPPDPGPGPEADALRGELAKRVRAAIDGLPEGQREVVHLRQIEDLSYAEIAEVLGIPVGTVRSRLHHGMARLAEALAPYLAESPGEAR